MQSKTVDGKIVWYVLGDPLKGVSLGAAQNVSLNQSAPELLAIEGESKALNVSGRPNSDYSLYVDITFMDKTHLWGQVATFKTGTHDWQFSRIIIESKKPVRSANVHLLFRSHSGTAWFRKVRFGKWDPAKREIIENLLGDGLNPSGKGKYVASPGQNAAKGQWGPYVGGYEVEEIAGEGPTVKVSTGTGAVRISDMHEADEAGHAAMIKLLKPVLPAEPQLTLSGDLCEQVFCDVSTTDGTMLFQLINYNAELHPDLPELAQQKADRTIPVRQLLVKYRHPAGRRFAKLTLKCPGQEDRPLETEGASFTIPMLEQYAAVVAEIE